MNVNILMWAFDDEFDIVGVYATEKLAKEKKIEMDKQSNLGFEDLFIYEKEIEGETNTFKEQYLYVQQDDGLQYNIPLWRSVEIKNPYLQFKNNTDICQIINLDEIRFIVLLEYNKPAKLLYVRKDVSPPHTAHGSNNYGKWGALTW